MPKTHKQCSFNEFAALYCSSQEQTPEGLREVLLAQRARYNPEGWLIHRCEMLDSSRLGERVIVPYGPNNTLKSPPYGAFSPRGLCSDMGGVEAIMLASELQA